MWGFIFFYSLVEIDSILEKFIVLFVQHPDPWKRNRVANNESQIVGTNSNSNSAANNSSLK